MNSSIGNRIAWLACLMSFVIALGTAGFVLLEGWTLSDSFYMTLITVSTVGYGEIQELSPSGRLFTSLLIVTSMISMVCWTAGITSVLVSNNLSSTIQKQRELKMISKMSRHVVVCGGGVMARTAIAGLIQNGKQVVVITKDSEQVALIKRMFPTVSFVDDEPTGELAMADANILQAECLIAATESDYDNLLITITANSLGTKIKIVSYVTSNDIANKMQKVGATHVVCPMVLCGEHITSIVCDEVSV